MNRVLPMIGAEFLKLRKRRGMLLTCLLLAVGVMVVVNAFLVAYHASNPAKYAPAGGVQGFTLSLQVFAFTALLAAVIIGATAGAQDVSSGVLRSLVVTGQSRLKLGLVRIPGGLLVLLPILALGYGLEVVVAFVFNDGRPTPDARMILTGAGWMAAVGVLNLTIALGLAALLRSRGIAIGILVTWSLAGSHMLGMVDAFGNWRALLSTSATDRFLPGATDQVHVMGAVPVTMTVGLAIAVMLVWMTVWTALGLFRTTTQDA